MGELNFSIGVFTRWSQFPIRIAALAAIIVAAFVFSIVGSSPAIALSIESVSIEQALLRSALVIEGRVVRSRTISATTYKTIFTCFEIAILDVLNGSAQGRTQELCFLGGTLDGITMHVPGMRYPEIGETGIYFVEAPGRLQVHPLYGGAQGHFRIVVEAASGRELVLTSDLRPVANVISSIGMTEPGLSAGVARGIVLGKSKTNTDAMTRSEFKRSLRVMLNVLKK